MTAVKRLAEEREIERLQVELERVRENAASLSDRILALREIVDKAHRFADGDWVLLDGMQGVIDDIEDHAFGQYAVVHLAKTGTRVGCRASKLTLVARAPEATE